MRGRPKPALLMTMSSRPHVSSASCTSASPTSRVADVAAVRDRLAAGGRDLGDDVGRGILVGRAAVGRDAGIVHDDPRAVRRQYATRTRVRCRARRR